MTTLRLRSLSRADIAWRQVMANWRHRGISASLAIPDNNGWLMRVTADDSAWSGVIDGREWLACQLPQLAALAESARDNANTLALFNAMEQPLTFEHNALPYRRLRAQAFTDSASLAANPVPCLSARECAV